MHDITTYQLAILAIASLLSGIWLLVKGGDMTIDSAVWIAEHLGLSKLFIAATIIAFGTSAPELFTSINANMSGYPGVSLGNVVGSNIANILMVLGASAIVMPIAISSKAVRTDVIVMLVATAILSWGMIQGIFPRWMGAGMVALLAGYIIYQWKSDKLLEEDDDGNDEGDADIDSKSKAVWGLILGLTALIGGSELLVQGAISGGGAIGVPEAVIGMTVVAFGTSLPELTTCIAAARKQQSEMIIGGILGSNIFNILSIVALTSVIKPLVADSRFLGFDLPMVILVTGVFAFIMLATGRIGRVMGVIFMAGYLTFIALQYMSPGIEVLKLVGA
jgi:cation:H+ antiporter